MRIVVVEDEDIQRLEAVRLLKSKGFDIAAFSNSLEALQYVRNHRPDVALLDWKLKLPPDGLFLARQLRNSFPACVIIMVSSWVAEAEFLEMLSLNVDYCFRKPYNHAELIERIGRAVVQRQGWFPSCYREEGRLDIDPATCEACWDGRKLPLTPTEYNIIATLWENQGSVVPHSVLYKNAIKDDEDRLAVMRPLLRRHVCNLRKKLDARGFTEVSSSIRAVRSRGYSWVENGAANPSDETADEEDEYDYSEA